MGAERIRLKLRRFTEISLGASAPDGNSNHDLTEASYPGSQTPRHKVWISPSGKQSKVAKK